MYLIDLLIVLLYLALVIGLGFYYARAAARNVDAYFLGGKRMHWLPLSMSGSVSNFDITGTMWIVSIIYLLGMKSMWHHWMWGFMLGAFFMAYMGKWVRRSNVLTAAEWMKTRFGDGLPGRLARATYALMAVLLTTSAIGYAYQGIGKFASVYVPLDDWAAKLPPGSMQSFLINHEADVLAAIVIGVTTLYVLLGGFFSVVVTDVVQTVILSIGSLYLAGVAWGRLTPAALGRLPDDFFSLGVPWRLPQFAGTANAQFEFFGALTVVWVLKGLLLNAGGPGQMYDFQRFLAARDPREAAKVGACWSVFLTVRWGMAMGIALLALTGAIGVADPELVMPTILREVVPVGVRGFIIAGLLAAFMSTFSSTVNSGASFVVRDIWQLFFRPSSTDRDAVRMSYISTVLLVAGGLWIGYLGESIAQIWNWMMMALGAGVIVPNVLRWYWWRLNGWGYTCGMLGGMLLAVAALLSPDIPTYVLFPLIVLVSLAACVVTSLLTKPCDHDTLVTFYESVQPFGAWGPVSRAASNGEERRELSESPSLALLNVALGMTAVGSAYLAPMYLVGHRYNEALLLGACCTMACTVLYFTWYRTLPPSHCDS